MQPAIRGYYRLEELWGDKEVKLGADKRISKRTAETPAEAAEPAAPAKRVFNEVNQAIQTTLDDDVKKPARKPRAATTKAVAAEGAAPKVRASRAKPVLASLAGTTSGTATEAKVATKKAAPRKKAIGTTVKVASSKSAIASAKQASVKRATAKRKTAA
jgi:ribosome-associated protein